MSHFHVIDVDHVPKSDLASYKDTSARVEELCAARSRALSNQTQHLTAHEKLMTQIRRLNDEVIDRISDRVGRAAAGLTVSNAASRLADIQV